jgi:hypothetical protein
VSIARVVPSGLKANAAPPVLLGSVRVAVVVRVERLLQAAFYEDPPLFSSQVSPACGSATETASGVSELTPGIEYVRSRKGASRQRTALIGS